MHASLIGDIQTTHGVKRNQLYLFFWFVNVALCGIAYNVEGFI